MKGQERLTIRDEEAVYTTASDWEIRYRLAEYEDIGTVEDFKKAVATRDQLIKNLKDELLNKYTELRNVRGFSTLQEALALQEALEDDGK